MENFKGMGEEGERSAFYCTCEHLSEELASRAARLVTPSSQTASPGRAIGERAGMSTRKRYLCVHCSSSLLEEELPVHFPQMKHVSKKKCSTNKKTNKKENEGEKKEHFLAVDVIHKELFCFRCGDYQYHSSFDRLLGHLRPGKLGGPRGGRVSPPGIVNMGSTCFMSSVLQLLMVSPSLVRFFEISECFVVKCKIEEDKDRSKNMKCIFCELQKIFLKNHSTGSTSSMSSKGSGSCKKSKPDSGSPLVPSSLLFAVWSYARHLASYEQQDAHEFLLALLDGLGAHLQRYHGDLNAAIAKRKKSYHSHQNGISSGAGGGDKREVLPVRRLLHSPRGPNSISDMDKSYKQPPSSNPNGCFTPRSASAMHFSSSPRDNLNPNETLYEFRGIVNEVFSGVLSSDLLCKACGYRSTTYDPFLDLSLSLEESDVESVRSDKSSQQVANGRDEKEPSKTIQECFDKFTSAEELHDESMTCAKCRAAGTLSKRLKIQTPPNVLIIHIKRFDISLRGGEVECVKINKQLEFPLHGLDILPFINFRNCDEPCSRGGKTSNKRASDVQEAEAAAAGPNKAMKLSIELPNGTAKAARNNRSGDLDGSCGVMYDLSGVVCHKGKSLTQGHYISYVKKDVRFHGEANIYEDNSAAARNNSRTVWLKCDDEAITEVGEEEVRGTQGYLLFYNRRQLQ